MHNDSNDEVFDPPEENLRARDPSFPSSFSVRSFSNVVSIGGIEEISNVIFQSVLKFDSR